MAFQILKKDYCKRTNADLLQLNSYFQAHNDFFQQILKDKGIIDAFKIYKCISLQKFSKDTVICNYGDKGDLFYVVIKGCVGVKVPTEVNISFKNYSDILRYLIDNSKSILRLKDNHSRVVKKLMDIVGQDVLWESYFASQEELIDFLELYLLKIEANCNSQDSMTTQSNHSNAKEGVLADEIKKQQFIQEFLK